jgi:diguanylate cyclase (GGDEF)-like protein
MNLDLNTLLYACAAGAVLAASVLSVFGSIQGTHPGFRWWVAAQWMLAAGLLMQALFGRHAIVSGIAALSVLQWPIVVLSGMRRLHMRRRPAIPALVDFGLLALAGAFVSAAWLSDVDPTRKTAAFALATFAVSVYAAALTTRLDGFERSLALKALVAILGLIAAIEALCGVLASVEAIGARGQSAVQLATTAVLIVAALGLVPIALALTYERTVAKMRAMHRKLRHLADIDALTRLPNRRHFLELATQSLASTEPAKSAVLMLDIENLKRINDLLGQATGDEALRQVGLALRETLRTRDVIGRLGGDEFAALLPNTSVADAVRVAARVTDRLDRHEIAPHMARLVLNVGAVQLRTSDTIIEGLRRADLALDDARNHRHDRPVMAHAAADEIPQRPAGGLEPSAV